MYSFNAMYASSINFVNCMKDDRPNFIPRVTGVFKTVITFVPTAFHTYEYN